MRAFSLSVPRQRKYRQPVTAMTSTKIQFRQCVCTTLWYIQLQISMILNRNSMWDLSFSLSLSMENTVCVAIIQRLLSETTDNLYVALTCLSLLWYRIRISLLPALCVVEIQEVRCGPKPGTGSAWGWRAPDGSPLRRCRPRSSVRCWWGSSAKGTSCALAW